MKLVAPLVLLATLASATPASAVRVCVGGDDRNNPGHMIGVCVENPMDVGDDPTLLLCFSVGSTEYRFCELDA